MSEKKNQVNYLSLFILGVSLLTVGILFTYAINLAFVSIMASGLLLMVIGLSKRDEWSGKKEE
jgi:hypothetical protein